MEQVTQDTLARDYARLAPEELRTHLMAALAAIDSLVAKPSQLLPSIKEQAQSMAREELLKNPKSIFQVISNSERNENGETVTKLELLREGETITEAGRRYVIAKNKKGLLYKKSIDPLGQIGVIKPVTVAEFQDQMLKQIDEAFPLGDGGAGFLAVFNEAKNRPKFEKSTDPVMEIQPLFNSLFSEKALEAMKFHRKGQISCVKSIDGKDQTLMVVYASIRIESQHLRNEKIAELIAEINRIADIGFMHGCQVPLTSVLVPVLDPPMGRTFIEKYVVPIIRYEEYVVFFPLVLLDQYHTVKGSSKLFHEELDILA